MSDDFGPDDIIAMRTMLARVVRGEDDKARIDAHRKVLDFEYLEAERRRSAAASSFVAFGFVINDKDFWQKVRTAMGDDAWLEAFALGGRHPAKNDDDNDENANGDDGAGLGTDDGAEPRIDVAEEAEASSGAKEDIAPMPDGMPTIREIVSSQLTAAGESGVKAATIRQYILQTYGQTVHDKTVGMTLYRLSKGGLARREGRIWFSAGPAAGEKNSGSDTPGGERGVASELS